MTTLALLLAFALGFLVCRLTTRSDGRPPRWAIDLGAGRRRVYWTCPKADGTTTFIDVPPRVAAWRFARDLNRLGATPDALDATLGPTEGGGR